MSFILKPPIKCRCRNTELFLICLRPRNDAHFILCCVSDICQHIGLNVSVLNQDTLCEANNWFRKYISLFCGLLAAHLIRISDRRPFTGFSFWCGYSGIWVYIQTVSRNILCLVQMRFGMLHYSCFDVAFSDFFLLGVGGGVTVKVIWSTPILI